MPALASWAMASDELDDGPSVQMILVWRKSRRISLGVGARQRGQLGAQRGGAGPALLAVLGERAADGGLEGGWGRAAERRDVVLDHRGQGEVGLRAHEEVPPGQE